MRFASLQTEAEWKWFCDRSSVVLCEDTQAIVVYRQGAIQAMVVFDTWTPDNVCVHMAIDNPMAVRHGLFHEVARHAYIEGGKQRLVGLVPSDNAKALKLNRNIGFAEVARVPNGVRTGVDTVVMQLEKENCRFLPAEYRRRVA